MSLGSGWLVPLTLHFGASILSDPLSPLSKSTRRRQVYFDLLCQRLQFIAAWPHGCRSVVRKNILAMRTQKKKLLTLWRPGNKRCGVYYYNYIMIICTNRLTLKLLSVGPNSEDISSPSYLLDQCVSWNCAHGSLSSPQPVQTQLSVYSPCANEPSLEFYFSKSVPAPQIRLQP